MFALVKDPHDKNRMYMILEFHPTQGTHFRGWRPTVSDCCKLPKLKSKSQAPTIERWLKGAISARGEATGFTIEYECNTFEEIKLYALLE